MKYYFPILIDGGNRGCEGIAKGTALIIGERKEKMIGLSTNKKLDNYLGTDKFYHLEKPNTSFFLKIVNKIFKILHLKSPIFLKNIYNHFLEKMGKGDIMISTGGDMLCYDTNVIAETNNFVHNNGQKSILWACSMGEENLTPIKEKTLKKFSYIYTRDSLTFEFFKKIGLQNIVCYPDPAFILQPEEITLPSYFKNNKLIGLNISNFTIGSDSSIDSLFGKEISGLIQYIIDHTSYDILLIPHVFWKGQDDRKLSKLFLEKFKSTKRIHLLESHKLNYLQIRYAISKCEMFIGARTHAIISAYSTFVPSLALGYSIKSKGIAKDIGLEESYVFNTKKFEKGDLIQAFKNLYENRFKIREHLLNTIPTYSKKTYEAKFIFQMI